MPPSFYPIYLRAISIVAPWLVHTSEFITIGSRPGPSSWDPLGRFHHPSTLPDPQAKRDFLVFRIYSQRDSTTKNLGGGYFPKPSDKNMTVVKLDHFLNFRGKTKKTYLKPFVGTCRKTKRSRARDHGKNHHLESNH